MKFITTWAQSLPDCTILSYQSFAKQINLTHRTPKSDVLETEFYGNMVNQRLIYFAMTCDCLYSAFIVYINPTNVTIRFFSCLFIKHLFIGFFISRWNLPCWRCIVRQIFVEYNREIERWETSAFILHFLSFKSLFHS